MIYGNYKFNVFSPDRQKRQNKIAENELSYLYQIEDIGFKSDFDYLPNPQHSIKAGLAITSHQFSPSAIVVTDPIINKFTIEVDRIDAIETGVYVEDTYKPFEKLKINAGLLLRPIKLIILILNLVLLWLILPVTIWFSGLHTQS